MIEIRAPYNYDVKKASMEAQTHCPEPSLALQDAADDADINVIVHRFGLTGTMPENPRVPLYGDFTEITDYQSALHAVREAEAQFMTLPPQLREHFEHNPQMLMEFAETQGHERLVELGLDLTVPMSMRTAAVQKTDAPASAAVDKT